LSVDPVSLAINAALIAANMAVTASQKFEGPRLDSLQVTTADYGAPLNYVYGTRRLDGLSCIWAEPLREVKRRRKTKGGKFNEYSYFGTWAVAVCDHEVDAFPRIWFDRNLIYDATGGGPLTPFAELGDITQYIRFYYGTDDQDVDPRMSATIDAEFGAGSTPAYRGVAYIVFEDVPLEKLGNRLPQVSVEVICNGGDAFPVDDRTAQFEAMVNGRALTYSPDRSRVSWISRDGDDYHLEVWDVAARAPMVHTLLDVGADEINDLQPGLLAITTAGDFYVVASPDGIFSSDLLHYEADGIGAPDVIALPFGGDHCQAITDGAGVERIFVTRQDGPGFDGALYTPGGSVETLDTSAATGTDWKIGWYCLDAYGDVWAFGQPVGATTTLCIWRVIDTGARPGSPSVAILTTGAASGSTLAANVRAYHHQSDGVDQFLVFWGQSSEILAVDLDTLTITDSDTPATASPYFLDVAFATVEPGAATIWIGGLEYSGETLAVVRDPDFGDWG
jgi:hypothetical protein